jgi:hypothetical protein
MRLRQRLHVRRTLKKFANCSDASAGSLGGVGAKESARKANHDLLIIADTGP